MIEIKASELKVGDIFYYNDSYEVVIETTQYTTKVKCIVGPSDGGMRSGLDNWYYLASYVTVKLLVRDGEEV